MKQNETFNHNNLLRVEAVVKPGPNRRMIGEVGGHVVGMDVSKERGGEDSSPSPPQYLVLSLAGCLMTYKPYYCC